MTAAEQTQDTQRAQARPQPRMTQRSLAALILLNVVLLAGLVVVGFAPQPAQAQLGGGGQYLMIAGKTAQRQSQSVVYVLNVRTAQVAALLYRSADNRVEPIDGRDIRNDLGGARGGR